MQTDNPCQSRWVGCHALPPATQSSLHLLHPQPSDPPALAVKSPSSCQTSPIKTPAPVPVSQLPTPSERAPSHVVQVTPLFSAAQASDCRVHLWETIFHDNQTWPHVKANIRSVSTRPRPRHARRDRPHPQHLNTGRTSKLKAWRCRPLLVAARHLSWLFCPCVTERASRYLGRLPWVVPARRQSEL
ncbi:uncharacterized protein LY79DRAFT_199129 [Colletotrichum navitas]|uniref:Uncharacterized protein n=1 Tax=Colletotrichum navitas TaxID=681940 RepID=A0AAD8V5V4_9PEZI|nr:uncharacterized protein LY79DRAFT_199129 [Colletotrichum navitas]KAK1590749.1 hypothetical protein LY79DRAFT_199129 [Colletotrichum navitas]